MKRALGNKRPEGPKPRDGPLRVLIEYFSIAGSIVLLINCVRSANWSDASQTLNTPGGQAVLVMFGAAIVTLLSLMGKLR